MNSLTLKELSDIFTYDGEYLRWKIDIKFGSHKKAGDVAGSIGNNGYMRVGMKRNGVRKFYTVHRLIYQLATSRDDLSDSIIIDHIDGNPLNNSIDNLREVSKTQNNLNAKLRKDNSTGYKNIIVESISKSTGLATNYRVTLSFEKKNYVAYARTIESALEKRDKIIGELFPEYARTESGRFAEAAGDELYARPHTRLIEFSA